jgi:adenosylcobinamide-phosphate synthase
VIEGAFAAALGVTLGGTNRDGDRLADRGQLGRGPAPSAHHVRSAAELARHTVVVSTAITFVVVAAISTAGAALGRSLRRARCVTA